MRTKPLALTAATALLTCAAAFAGPVAPGQGRDPTTKRAGGHVDVVIALDTSSSMDGLIDNAREKLWDVVNVLNQARPRPVLRVGLISYGNDGYDKGAGWVRTDADLTTDLDSVYAKLFALRTNGGEEYVARALTVATDKMHWDQDPETLKIVFVAGNEPANQDPQIPVEKAVSRAREHHIIVNTIYCGSERNGEARLWAEVASRGSGRYAAIDHNQVVAIATPMDRDLERLSAELNGTYIAYGAQGGDGLANQGAQDKNAATTSPSAAAGRAITKSTALYDNSRWDLVDAKKRGKDVAKLEAGELPPQLRAMKPAERAAYVDAMEKKRAAIQKQIQAKAAERDRYLQAERAKMAHKGTSFDDAVTGSIRTEATAAGYAF